MPYRLIMKKVIRAYFEKALNMQTRYSNGVLFGLGAVTTFLAVYIPSRSSSAINGYTTTHHIIDIDKNYSLIQTTQNPFFDSEWLFYLVMFAIFLVYVAGLIYLILKYREYNQKFIKMTTIHMSKKYIKNNFDDDYILNNYDWMNVYVYIIKHTQFSRQLIADALNDYYYNCYNGSVRKFIDSISK